VTPILENIPLAPHSTFRLGGLARYFAEAGSPAAIPELVAFAQKKNLPIHVLGEGSNTIFSDAAINKFFLKLGFDAIREIRKDQTEVVIEIEAGVSWDKAVAWSVERGYQGIETLSGIPGTVGAAPIQNIGAYGQEFANVAVEIRAYDIESSSPIVLRPKDCEFGYRISVFKKSGRGRYIITGVTIRLSLLPPAIPAYPGIKEKLASEGISSPSLQDIRRIILATRAEKLPDPRKYPNVGSFFENPLISQAQAEKLKRNYPNLPIFPASGGKAKVSAGWLIDACGLKEKDFDHLHVDKRNALVLVNDGSATFQTVIETAQEIIKSVRTKFGIELEIEPDLVS